MDTLQEAINSARIYLKSEVERELSEVSQIVERLSRLKNNLFGIEESSKGGVAEKLAEVELRKAELEGIIKHSEKYRLLSMEILNWRDGNGWPKLAMFGLESKECALKVHCVPYGDGKSYFREVRPDYTPSVNFPAFEIFDDVFKKLAEDPDLVPGKEKSITMEFSGVIPEDVREKILAAKKEFKKIFIIAEARWQEKLELDKDPLVVGWDGANLWLIAAFYPTKFEHHVESEQTS